ncbi:MAG: anaphase-promoting complex subunit cdc27 [Icmadophila ericetorum]|nr:anaphase-promoting complex subunit cdc27 [Icmadophila ericetorum]
MPLPNHHTTAQLRQLTYYNLDCNLLRNALFLSGRLYACEPKLPEASYLQGLCYLRLGQLRAAYDSCKLFGQKGTNLGCAYVFAQACLALEKYNDGIQALERSKSLWHARNNWNKHTDTRRQHLPDAAAVQCLLGKLYQGYKDTNQAIECYTEAVKLNPFMWDAFRGLCDLGVNIRVPNVFKMTAEMESVLQAGPNEEISSGVLEDTPAHPQATNSFQTISGNDPFTVSTGRANGDNRAGKRALYEKLNGSTDNVSPVVGHSFEGLDTPVGPGSNGEVSWNKDTGKSMDGAVITEPPLAPPRKPHSTLYGLGMDFSTASPPKMKTSTWRSKSKTQDTSEESDQVSTNLLSTLASGITDRKRTNQGRVPQAAPSNNVSQSVTNLNDPMAPQRRSTRLLNQIRPQSSKFSASNSSMVSTDGRELKKAKMATGTKGRSAQVGRVVSGNRTRGESVAMDIDGKESRHHTMTTNQVPNSRPVVNEKIKEIESLQWLLDLFAKLGSGYYALCHFQTKDALQIFNSLPTNQRETPWVLARIGRAFYEQASYKEAEKYFARVKIMAPSRLEDMEVYSTVLWHLGNDIDLAYLAHEISDIDRLSPQAWCAIGNSFSLQKDYDQALKCFKRATQLDPKFTYGYTLQGHEHFNNEELDKSLAAYRQSIAVDSRHYHGWYGLAKVYQRQGKYDIAEQHYRTASGINPANAVLICSIGIVLEKMKKYQQALAQYTRSSEMAPTSTMARFRKASILVSLDEVDQALTELKILKDLDPDEANIHYLLGQVYKKVGQRGLAIKHYTTAMNLDPKASHVIKEQMEQMEDEEDEDGLK